LEGSDEEDDAGDDPIESTVDPPPQEDEPPPRGLGDFALFSATSLQCGGSSTIDHLIGSNSDITLGATCDARGIVGGGSLTTGANLTAEGDVVVNGPVTLGGNTEITGDVDVSEGATLEGVSVGGNVTAAGSVTLRNATIRGNLAAGGNVQGNANFCLHGNASADGDLTLQSNARIYGEAAYTGSLDARPRQILGTAEQVGAVNPSPEQYSPYVLPPATTFTAGSQDEDVSVSSNATLDLPPGHYGALTLGGGAEITFAAGQYYFESITAQGNVDLTLEVDDDEGIEIFVAGDVALGGTVGTQIQGSGTAANVYLAQLTTGDAVQDRARIVRDAERARVASMAHSAE
jgi:cytoskeletal protein CcmA (bactofilin family)